MFIDFRNSFMENQLFLVRLDGHFTLVIPSFEYHLVLTYLLIYVKEYMLSFSCNELLMTVYPFLSVYNIVDALHFLLILHHNSANFFIHEPVEFSLKIPEVHI